MTDIASLTVQVDTSSAKEGKKVMDEFTASGKRAEEGTNNLLQSQMNARAAHMKAQEAVQANRDANVELDKSVQKLLDRYDPLGTKLRQLQSDFAMLDKAATAGALGKGSDAAVDKTYAALNVEIAKTKDLMVAAGVTTEKTGLSMLSLGLNTQYARRELMTMGREALSGDFSRMPMTFGSLAAHSNIMALALNPVVIGLVALTAAAGLFALAFVKGVEETEKMNNALSITNNYAGLTTGTMRELAQQVSTTGSLTVGVTKNIVGQLTESGRIGAASIGAVARIAQDYAAATGKDIDKVSGDLVKLFNDPAKGAAELNQQMHFLSITQIDHIKHLQDIGQLDAAQLELAHDLADFLPHLADRLGTLGRAWDAVKKSASEAWDGMLAVGRDKTAEEKLKDAQKWLQLQEQLPKNLQDPDKLNAARAKVNDLIRTVIDAQEAAAKKAHESEMNRLDQENNELAKKYSKYAQIKEINDQLARLEDFRPPSGSSAEVFRSQSIEFLKKKKDDLVNPNDLLKNTDASLRKKADEDIAKVNVWAGADETRIFQAMQAINNIEDAYDKATGAYAAREKAKQDAIKATAKAEKEAHDEGAYQEKLDYDAMVKNANERTKHQAQIDKFDESQKENIDKLKQEGEVYNQNAMEREMAVQARRLENEYTKAQIGLNEKELETLKAKYDARKAQLADAVEAKVIGKQIEDAQKKAAEQQQKIWDTLVKGIQHTLGDGLYQAMQGNFKGIGQLFLQMLQRMLADAMAANIVSAITGNKGSSLSTGASVFAAIFAPAATRTGGGAAGIGAGIGSINAAAKGAYFDDSSRETSNSVSRFAAGSSFDSGAQKFATGGVFEPTIRKFATGGLFEDADKFAKGGAFDGEVKKYADGDTFDSGIRRFATGGVFEDADKFAKGEAFDSGMNKYAAGGVFEDAEKFAKGGMFVDEVKRFANGGVFDEVKRFAYGDIVDTPTPFTFGGGRRGEMGEAGPEAIMPLKRDSSGRLGVAGGGGGGIQVTYAPVVHIDSRTDQSQVKVLVDNSIRAGNADLVEKLQRAGAIK